MHQKVNLVKNIFYSTISTFSNLFMVVLLIILSRYLGVENLGIFTFALAFVSVFELFLDFGLRDLGVRDVARDLSLTGKYQGNLFVWQSILFCMVYFVMVIVIHLLKYDAYTRNIIYLLGAATFLRKIKFTFRIFFQAHNRFDLDTLLVAIERIALLCICTVVIVLWKDLLLLSLAFLCVRVIDIAILFMVLHYKVHSIQPKFDFSFIRAYQIDAFPRGLSIVIFVLLSYLDTIMLKQMIGYQEVGFYNIAYKVYEGVIAAPLIFYLVVLPRLSQLYVSDRQRHWQLSSHVVKYMFVIVIPVVVNCYIFSDFVVQIFSKTEFIKASITLKILAVGMLLHFPVFMLHTILLSTDCQKVILRNGLIALIINVIMNALLIPRFGCYGAASATVLSEMVLFGLAWCYLYIHDVQLSIYHIIFKPLTAGVLFFGILMCWRSPVVFMPVIVGGCIYVTVLFLLKIFNQNELQNLYRQATSIF